MKPFLAYIMPVGGDDGPGQPPHIWGGANEPFPTPPIANVPGAPGYRPPSDAHPEHPIVLPPTGTWPPSDAHPEHPIVIPPEGPPPGEQPPTGPVGVLEWHSVWTAEYGWAVVGVQSGPHVTPSGPASGPLGTTVKKDAGKK